MVQRHTCRFGAAKLREDGADGDILDAGGVEVGVFGKGCFQDLSIGFSI